MTLVLRGSVPTKKNQLRPRAGRGRAHRYDASTAADLERLITYARIQWGPRDPLESPRMEFRFFVLNARQDRDGILTTILDCLKTARVLIDDSIYRCNGELLLHPAQLVAAGEERVEVTLGT